MHANSLAAYHEGKEDAFNAREILVLRALKALGTGTDRDVMNHWQFREPNAVRPRITDLLHKGVIEEIGTRLDEFTGKRVRIVRIRPAFDTAQAMLAGMEAIA